MSKTEETKTTAAQPAVVAKTDGTPAQRFVAMVLKNFADNPGKLALTNFHQKLVQNYFIKLDMVLKAAEAKRMMQPEDRREPLAYTWQNVNSEKLAVEVVVFATIGIDPMQPNHINLIPYKNNATKKYDINFLMGYRGLELKAVKYGVDVPDDVIVEVVHKKDKFKPLKKNSANRIESFEFEINPEDPFDRGDVVGGFYYYNYIANPEKNKLRIMSLADIEKRKPSRASSEFWGGTKGVYEKGKKVGEEKIEGWFEEMVYKTLYRAAYNGITIDSEKIDEHYVKLLELEAEANKTTDERAEEQVRQHSAKTKKDFTFAEEAKVEEETKPVEPVEPAEEKTDTTTTGPDF